MLYAFNCSVTYSLRSWSTPFEYEKRDAYSFSAQYTSEKFSEVASSSVWLPNTVRSAGPPSAASTASRTCRTSASRRVLLPLPRLPGLVEFVPLRAPVRLLQRSLDPLPAA